MSDNNQESLEHIWVTDFNVEAAIMFHEKVIDLIKQNPKKPIIINIDSYGGEVDGLFSMIDTIEEARALGEEGFMVVTSIRGKAMSAGAVLATCGDYSFASPNSRIMIHQIQGAAWGDKKDIDIKKEELDRLNDLVLKIILKNCKIKGGRQRLHNLTERDNYITPQEAKTIGLINVVGNPQITELKGFQLTAVNIPEEPKGGNRKLKRTTKKSKKS